MEKQEKNFFLQLLQNLSSKSPGIRYHSQYALRSFSQRCSGTVIQEFANYFQNDKINFEPRILKELSFLIENLPENDETGLGGLNSIMQSIENKCISLESIKYVQDIMRVCEVFFNKFPDFFLQLYDSSKDLKILTTLTAAQFLAKNEDKNIIERSILLLKNTKNDDKEPLFYKYALALLITTLYPFMNNLPEDTLIIYKDKAKYYADFFFNSHEPGFAQFIPTLLQINIPNNNEISEKIKKISILVKNNTSIASDLIQSLVILLSRSDKYSDFLLVVNTLIPILSTIPFHFCSVIPDDSITNGYKMAVKAVQELFLKYPKIIPMIVDLGKSGSLEQMLGCQYCITCLIKAGVKLQFSDFSSLFEKVNSPLEAGTLSELVLTAITKGIQIMDWEKILTFLEECFEISNDISKQFPIDACFELGKTLDCEPNEFLNLISSKIQSKYKYSALYFTILDSYVLMHQQISIDSFPPLIILSLCLFKAVKTQYIFSSLEKIFPELKSLESILSFVESLDSNKYSPIARSFLTKFNSSKEMKLIICRFLVFLIDGCSQQEAALNCAACVSALQSEFEMNIDLISSLYASYINIEPTSAIQSISSLVASLSKGWFIFSSSVKSISVIKFIYNTLLNLKKNINLFLLFSSEHLPDPSDEESSVFVIKTLAEVFRSFHGINQEFPPKCRLLDFVISVSEPNNPDIFRCMSTLLPIPPTCPSEQIPIVTDLILKTTFVISKAQSIATNLTFDDNPLCTMDEYITEEIRLLLRSALMIAETPNDIKLLMEPFVKHINEEIPYSLFLSLLEAISGENKNHHQMDETSVDPNNDNNSETIDFVSLEYDASQKLFSNESTATSSYDLFLSLMAETIGICLPIYEKTHVAVQYILMIMCKQTREIDIKIQLSFHEAVKCVSSSFNSQCLMTVAEFLCANQTMASVTAFIILLQERESEMLHYVHQFVQNLLKSKQPNVSLIFEANETLAKAAASLITVEHFDILKAALKNAKYRDAILEVLKEMPVERCEELKMILNDPELKGIVDKNSIEMQFVIILTHGNPSDIKTWSEEKILSFLDLLGKHINKLSKDQQLNFAHFVSSVEETKCISKSVHIFSPFFKDIDFISYFATSPIVLPVLLQVNENNNSALKYFVPISLNSDDILDLLQNVIHIVLYSLLKSSEFTRLLIKQKNLQLLKPYLPLIVSSLLSPHDASIIQLISLISEHDIITIPSSFVSLMEICDSLEFGNISPNCISTLIKKSQSGIKTRNLCALTISSYLCKCNALDETNYQAILSYIIQVMSTYKENDSAQEALIVCFSCFPLYLFLS